MGLRSSEGKLAEAGVWRVAEEAATVRGRLSKPAAAMTAVAVAVVAMLACRRLGEVETGDASD